jgi:hypothetical protein
MIQDTGNMIPKGLKTPLGIGSWRCFPKPSQYLTSAEGKSLSISIKIANDIFEHSENLVNPLCSKVMTVLDLTQALPMCKL